MGDMEGKGAKGQLQEFQINLTHVALVLKAQIAGLAHPMLFLNICLTSLPKTMRDCKKSRNTDIHL